MAKVQGVVSSKGSSMEDLTSENSGDKTKKKILNVLKTGGKILLKTLIAAGVVAGGAGAIFAGMPATALAVANNVALAGGVAELADVVVSTAEGFNTGKVEIKESYDREM